VAKGLLNTLDVERTIFFVRASTRQDAWFYLVLGSVWWQVSG